MISASAAGSLPTTQIAPGPAWPKASRTAAAGRLMPAVRASRVVSISSLLQITGYPVIPAATIALSVTTAAPTASSALAAASACSSHTRSVAKSKSALAAMTCSVTARLSGGRRLRSIRDRRIRYDSSSAPCSAATRPG